MLSSLFKNPFSRFLIVSTTLYLSWYFFYEFYLKDHSLIDEWVIDSLVNLGEGFLKLIGYPITDYADGLYRVHFGVAGSKGVTIGAPCDGIVLFALFIVFIISYPGPIKHKLWFLPAGLVFIHLINVLRVSALALIVYHKQDWFSFNHDYTFTLIVYAIVFGLWWIWITKFSKPKVANEN